MKKVAEEKFWIILPWRELSLPCFIGFQDYTGEEEDVSFVRPPAMTESWGRHFTDRIKLCKVPINGKFREDAIHFRGAVQITAQDDANVEANDGGGALTARMYLT